jgi:hypothetical protein
MGFQIAVLPFVTGELVSIDAENVGCKAKWNQNYGGN